MFPQPKGQEDRRLIPNQAGEWSVCMNNTTNKRFEAVGFRDDGGLPANLLYDNEDPG